MAIHKDPSANGGPGGLKRVPKGQAGRSFVDQVPPPVVSPATSGTLRPKGGPKGDSGLEGGKGTRKGVYERLGSSLKPVMNLCCSQVLPEAQATQANGIILAPSTVRSAFRQG